MRKREGGGGGRRKEEKRRGREGEEEGEGRKRGEGKRGEEGGGKRKKCKEEILFLIPLNIYPEVELLDHIILFLNVEERLNCFP